MIYSNLVAYLCIDNTQLISFILFKKKSVYICECNPFDQLETSVCFKLHPYNCIIVLVPCT